MRYRDWRLRVLRDDKPVGILLLGDLAFARAQLGPRRHQRRAGEHLAREQSAGSFPSRHRAHDATDPYDLAWTEGAAIRRCHGDGPPPPWAVRAGDAGRGADALPLQLVVRFRGRLRQRQQGGSAAAIRLRDHPGSHRRQRRTPVPIRPGVSQPTFSSLHHAPSGRSATLASGLGVGSPIRRERVAIDVIDQTFTVGHAHLRVLLVRPRAVVVNRDVHAEADRPEGPVEERIRQDAVDLRAERRADLELGGIGLGRARRPRAPDRAESRACGERCGRPVPRASTRPGRGRSRPRPA